MESRKTIKEFLTRIKTYDLEPSLGWILIMANYLFQVCIMYTCRVYGIEILVWSLLT